MKVLEENNKAFENKIVELEKNLNCLISDNSIENESSVLKKTYVTRTVI